MLMVKDVGYTYRNNKHATLANINFECELKTFLSIIGESSVGKTTLLKILCGLYKPSKGSVKLLGKDPEKFRGTGDIAYVPQSNSLFEWLNVKNNALMPFNFTKKSFKQGENIDKRLKQLIIDLNLEDGDIDKLQNKKTYKLSGGQQSRCQLLRALIVQPKILLLDEPFSNLDALTRKKTSTLINRISKQYNLTTIMVTHDIDEAITLSDKIILLDKNDDKKWAEISKIYDCTTNKLEVKNELYEKLKINDQAILV
jgi:ABC-type nitrate/sulfonate/bicarbonate transport system ATPase subunit